MRIVCTSDTHFPFQKEMIPDGDVFIHAGDLMYTGYPEEWYPRLESLSMLPHAKKIYVPGNHDFHIQNYLGIANQELMAHGVKLLGTGAEMRWAFTKLPNGMTVMGLPYVTGLPSWAFSKTEYELSNILEALMMHFDPPDIVVTHQPPMYLGYDNNFGSSAYNRFMNTYKPKYWICGHIHEMYGTYEVNHGDSKTILINAAMCNRDYAQVNEPIVIDV